MDDPVTIARFDDLPWEEPPDDQKRERGLRGKRPVWGEAGFYVQHVSMPPGYDVAPHRHDRDEIFLVLEGSCTLDDGRTLRPNDAAVLHAGHAYGFSVDEEPFRFLVVRAGEATNERVDA